MPSFGQDFIFKDNKVQKSHWTLVKLPGGCHSLHVPSHCTCFHYFVCPHLPDEAAEAQREQGSRELNQCHTASWHEVGFPSRAQCSSLPHGLLEVVGSR